MLDVIVEVIGYVGMAFVVISFGMKKMTLLRILNTIGAVLCCVYGFVTKTYPTAVLNVLLIIINVYYLIRYLIEKKRVSKKEKSENELN